MGVPQFVIHSRPGCCLCEQANRQLTALRKRYQFELQEVNILENPASYDTYKDEIPVICIDGETAFKHRLDERRFVRIMQSPGRKWGAETSSTT